MPDTLYPAGAQLLGDAAQTATKNADLQQQKTEATMKSGEAAAGNISAERQQISSQQAAMALEKMKASDKMQGKVVTITPQIALGLVKNTGDREWMQAIGQDMRADVLMGLYTHGLKTDFAKRQPKITQIYQGGKIRHAVVYTDENGTQQELLLDSGITPESLNKGKGSGGRGGGSSIPLDFRNEVEFKKSYEKNLALLKDPMQSKELQKTDPDRYAQIKDMVSTYGDKYDAILKKESAGGKEDVSGGSSGGGDESPFDADAFIREATSGQ